MEIDGYERFELIGVGGFGEVYRAYQPRLDRFVAVKVVRAEVWNDSLQARFEGEVSLVARVAGHPNVVPVLDAGRTRDGRAYFTMPLYTRGTLSGLLAEQGPMDYEAVLRVGVKLASALAALHEVDVMHGDVKPQNVLMNAYGEVALADFGLARLASSAASSGSAGITITHAAPEAISGTSAAGPASDVYSLASTLYTCRMGRDLWESNGRPVLELIQLILTTEPSLSDEVEAGLLSILRDGLAKQAGERPSAREMAKSLQQLQVEAGFIATELHGVASTHARAPESRLDAAPTPPPAAAFPYARPPAAQHDISRTIPPPGRSARSLPGWLTRKPSLPVWKRHATPVGGARAGKITPSSYEHLRSDRPTDRDELGQAPLVQGLARLLNDPGTGFPLTVGIGGRWGSGKTSLMLQLQNELTTAHKRDPHNRAWVPVWFEAWRFQGREALWAGLTRAIYNQGAAQLRPPRRLWFRILLEQRRRGTARFLGASLALIGGAFYLSQSVMEGLEGDHRWAVFAGMAAGAAAISTAAAYIGLLSEPFNRALARGSVTKRYEEFLGISDAAERDVNHLVQTLSACAGGACILVYLDDLDRCQPATISEALAAVTNIFGREEGDPIAFLLGVDMDMVLGAVDDSLRPVRESMKWTNPRRAADMANDFLEKVFQLIVSLDSLRRVPVELLLVEPQEDAGDRSASADVDFLGLLDQVEIKRPEDVTMMRHEIGIHSADLGRGQLAALHKAVRSRRADLLTSRNAEVRVAQTGVVRELRLTPRAAKRFDSAYRLQLQVANGTPGCQLTYSAEELLALAKWVALRSFFPSLSKIIDRQPGLWQELELGAPRENAPLRLRERLQEHAPDLDAALYIEFNALLSLGLPQASLGILPMDTFLTVM